MEPVGQASMQAGFSQWLHAVDTNVRVTLGKVPSQVSTTVRRAHVAASMPFHCLQAISQA